MAPAGLNEAQRQERKTDWQDRRQQPARQRNILRLAAEPNEAFDAARSIERELLGLRTDLDRYRPAHQKYNRIQKDIQALEEYREELHGLETEAEVHETMQSNPKRRVQQDKIDEYELELAIANDRIKTLEVAI